MGRWMDGQMDGWADGWMGGWMDGRMDGWADGWMGRQMIYIFSSILLEWYSLCNEESTALEAIYLTTAMRIHISLCK